jgi:DNA helicase II / ATP-dependent DNA helicase PcrA
MAANKAAAGQSADFLSGLNPSQRQAVEHYCGPLLVVAGAGSGKTRALTFRIANLVLVHQVEPENILAVTFTNKAAKEMKERIEKLFAERQALAEFGKPLEALKPYEQTKLKSQVYKTITKHLWIGTFHALCCRILRFDIEKYEHESGLKWDKNFSIFDESDVQGLIKDIVINKLNLDDKKFDPKSMRYAVSNAKNQGLSPQELAKEQPDYRGRTVAQVYEAYQKTLAANNALDFDDLILMPVKLFEQNETVRSYWHRRFRHLLVDEYQDTNRTQYDLIRLLATGGVDPQKFADWKSRSVFVVGDADQSIYSFRSADFRILMGFQDDFGDRRSDAETQTMVKLEENYRSTANILEAANALIDHNTERIDKILRATRAEGDPIQLFRADDEIAEAHFVVEQIRRLEADNPNLHWGKFAVLYRTNAQSRALEECLVKWQVPYKVIGGLRFYDRREIKDVLGYLRAIANPADTVSLLRVINTPKRGVGKSTIDALVQASAQLNQSLWDTLSDETSVKTLAGRSSKGVLAFAGMIQKWQNQLDTLPANQVVQGVLEDSGYIQALQMDGTEESQGRIENVQELYNAVLQFEEDSEAKGLPDFLASAALSSDLDNQDEEAQRVSLMTLHASKGLEFPVVAMVGLEHGLFPSFRSLDDPAGIEEERRLCYVGITRAQQQLMISYARERRLYGHREPASPSMFLAEIPRDLLSAMSPGAIPAPMVAKGAAGAKGRSRFTTLDQTVAQERSRSKSVITDWAVGDRVQNATHGRGLVTQVLGKGTKIILAIRFNDQRQQKIIDPRLTPLDRLES